MPPSGAHRDRLVVGLDFGTTFSGCAFAYSGSLESPDEIEVIRNWPGSNNITSEKVPTELTYEPASTGAGVKRTAAGEPSLFNDPRHAKTRLERRFPLMVATTQIDIVITVTAVWSDAAKDVTMKAAEKAGMGENLFMVSEPDAAAIYAMKSIDVQQNFAWQVTTSSSVTHGVAQLIWPLPGPIRGAVLAGLERDLVVSRKARRHYGVVCSVSWDPSIHSLKNKFVDRITKELRARNQMLWYIERGQDMPSDEPILFSLTEDLWPGEGSGSESSARIIVSDAEVPPQEYEPTNETRVLCTLSTDLDKSPESTLKDEWYTARHTIAWIRIDDKVYGSIEAVYT
ncbi:hypothetical protein KCV04_g4523, partial [Aureobasidium melanogenum]